MRWFADPHSPQPLTEGVKSLLVTSFLQQNTYEQFFLEEERGQITLQFK